MPLVRKLQVQPLQVRLAVMALERPALMVAATEGVVEAVEAEVAASFAPT